MITVHRATSRLVSALSAVWEISHDLHHEFLDPSEMGLDHGAGSGRKGNARSMWGRLRMSLSTALRKVWRARSGIDLVWSSVSTQCMPVRLCGLCDVRLPHGVGATHTHSPYMMMRSNVYMASVQNLSMSSKC